MWKALNSPVILTEIFLNSNKNTLYNSVVVSKQWNDILNKEFFWKEYYERNFPKNKSLDKLITQIPNHTYRNLCKYKLANKKQLVSNFQDKKSYPICSLNNINNFNNEIMCIKQDCLVWFDREKLCLCYIEFSEPDNVREFHVGSDDVVKIEIIGNLIVCVKEDCIVILFSRVKKHKDWHRRLVNEPEHDNGDLFIRNSCLIDNLLTISFFELIQEGDGNGENPEFQAECRVVVYDLNYLINALEDKDLDEENLYDIIIDYVLIPIDFEAILIHNCTYMKLNEETGVLEKNYYVLAGSAEDGKITIFMFDEYLKLKEERTFQCEIQDELVLWASIHADGNILLIGKKEIEMFSVEDTNMENVRIIPADMLENYNPYDIIYTPELLYIMFYKQRQVNDEVENDQADGEIENDQANGEVGNNQVNGEVVNDQVNGEVGNDQANGEVGNDQANGEVGNDQANGEVGNDQANGEVDNDQGEIENEVHLAILDISDDIKHIIPKKEVEAKGKAEENVNDNTKIPTLCTKFNDIIVTCNMFVDTGIVHYNPETNQVLYTPFSKCFCEED